MLLCALYKSVDGMGWPDSTCAADIALLTLDRVENVKDNLEILGFLILRLIQLDVVGMVFVSIAMVNLFSAVGYWHLREAVNVVVGK